MEETTYQAIVQPAGTEARRRALWELLAHLEQEPQAAIPAEVAQFLAAWQTNDLSDAALGGLILLARGHAQTSPPPMLLARLLPVLRSWHEPELQARAIAAFGASSPRAVYQHCALILSGDEPASQADEYYAYSVLAAVDHSSLRDTVQEFIGR